jgi:hypothetical protein
MRGPGHADGEQHVVRVEAAQRTVAGAWRANPPPRWRNSTDRRERRADAGCLDEDVDRLAGQPVDHHPVAGPGTGCSGSMCRWLGAGIGTVERRNTADSRDLKPAEIMKDRSW